MTFHKLLLNRGINQHSLVTRHMTHTICGTLVHSILNHKDLTGSTVGVREGQNMAQNCPHIALHCSVLDSIRSVGSQTNWGTNKIHEAVRGRKLNIHFQLDKSILIKLWGGQITKYAPLLFFENVEI